MQSRRYPHEASSSADTEAEALVTETFDDRPIAQGVAVVDGYGCRVEVSGHHLVLVDGLGPHRRERRVARATHGLSRVLILGTSGTFSFQAGRWLADAGVAFAQLDVDGPRRLLLVSGTPGRDDA